MDDSKKLDAWFHVSFNDEGISWNVAAPGGEPWTDFVSWGQIIRVCFKSAEFFLSTDEIYIFSKERPESYVIPMEADGGSDVWNELITRDLFDAELAIKAASAGEGELFCWPSD